MAACSRHERILQELWLHQQKTSDDIQNVNTKTASSNTRWRPALSKSHVTKIRTGTLWPESMHPVIDGFSILRRAELYF